MAHAGRPEGPGVVVIGTNHRQAPVEFRERVAFAPDEMTSFLARIHSTLVESECFMVSTCNRTEIYTLVADPAAAGSHVRRLLAEFKPVDAERDAHRFYEHHGRGALEQLYRVACGLDSLVLGEAQILQQVQDGYEASLLAKSLGVLGDHIVAGAIRCGRRARSETEISHGAVSVAFAAVSLAHKVFGDLTGRAALVLGAGDTGALVSKHLREHGIGRLLVVNRNIERARTLAAEMRGEPLGLESLASALAQVDIVITATSAPLPLIDAPMVRAAMKARQHRSYLLVDIGVPRDVHPDVRRIDNVFLHDVDGLQVMIEQTLLRRRREVPKVEKIVTEEIDRFLEWHSGLQAAPAIKELRGRMEELRNAEIERHASHLTPDQRAAVDMVTRALLNKVMHRPTTLLRDATSRGEAGIRHIEAVREVFGLNGSSVHAGNHKETHDPAE